MVLKLCHGRCECFDKHDLRFAETSTCHGLERVCNTWHICRRIVWLLLIFLSIALLTITLHERFTWFLKFEVRTSMAVKTFPEYALPTVTLCNMNMFSATLLNSLDRELLNISDNLINWMNIELNAGADSFFSEIDPKNATAYFWNKVAEYEKLEEEVLKKYNVSSFSVDEWIFQKGWQINGTRHPTLLYCLIGSQQCEEDAFKPVLTPQGLCYTLMNNGPEKRYFQRAPGAEAGYSIVLDIDQAEYTGVSLDSEKQFECGLKVLLHEPGDYLHVGTNLASFVGVPPGVVGYIAARPTVRQMVDTRPLWLDCVDGDENMSIQACLARCSIKDTLKMCNCRMWFEDGAEPMCGVARTTACLIFREKSLDAPYLDPIDATMDSECYDNCQHACKETSYEVDVSYTLLTSEITAEQLAVNLNMLTNFSYGRYTSEYIKANFISLSIAYPELTVETDETSPVLTITAFIGDLGGQLGLFAGVSIITIAELLEYPFVKLCSILSLNKKRHKNKTNGGMINQESIVLQSQNQIPRIALNDTTFSHDQDAKENGKLSRSVNSRLERPAYLQIYHTNSDIRSVRF